MPVRFLLVILLLPVAALGQLLNGVVNDNQGKPVAFANVGVPQLRIGTVADEQGRFRLDLTKAASGHTLLVSAIGYELRSFPVASLTAHAQPVFMVTLPEKINQLLAVQVRAKQPKAHRLGNKPDGAATISFGSDVLGTELGIPVRLNRPAFVKAIQIAIAENENDSIQIRINFYQLVQGRPTENLLRRSIIADLPKGETDFSLDVSAEKITLDSDFMLAVEIVNVYGRRGFGQVMFKAGLTNGPTFMRVTSQAPFEKADDGAFSLGAAFSVTALY
jgi:hypothetical protein